MHLVGCLYYCICDARSNKHQIYKKCFYVELIVIINKIYYCCI